MYPPNTKTSEEISSFGSGPSFSLSLFLWQQLMTAINHRLRFFLWEIWETLYRLVNNGEERDSLVECKKWPLCSQSAVPNWNKWPTLPRGQKVQIRSQQKYFFGRMAGVIVCNCRGQYDRWKNASAETGMQTLLWCIFHMFHRINVMKPSLVPLGLTSFRLRPSVATTVRTIRDRIFMMWLDIPSKCNALDAFGSRGKEEMVGIKSTQEANRAAGLDQSPLEPT